MRKIFLCLTAAAALGGCTSDWDSGKVSGGPAVTKKSSLAADAKAGAGQRAVNARLPDRGHLIAYDLLRPSERRAAFTYHAIDLSEEHALNASHPGGKIEIQTPSGKAMSFAYDRHVDHGDGNWTWVGRTVEGLDAVITFGAEAVVGRISQPNTESLRLAFSNGRSWLVETDPSKLRHPGSRRSLDHDVAIVPKAALEAVRAKQNAKGGVTANAVSAATGPSDTIDVVLGYTPGFVVQNNNSTSVAVTTLTNRIELANQAFASSLVTPRVRLVHTLLVNYTDTNNNGTALDQLSGQTCTTVSCTTIPVPVELQPLRNARELFGGDLVSLVRPLKEPEHGGCGIAWLLGPNNSTIDGTDAPFAYSIVSSGSDVRESDGFTYSCPNETLAHEMAHNMGQQHNPEDSDSVAGTHTYSYGYRETRTDGFYTIMAYPAASSTQFLIPYFGNPNVSHPGTGRPTGTAAADNARSLNQSMLLVAQFRNTVVPFDPTAGTIVGAGGKCLDAANFGVANGTPIQVWDCSGSPNQKWKFQTGGIVGVESFKAIDLIGFGSANGTQMHLWSWSNTANQIWAFKNTEIVSLNGGGVLDVIGGQNANGAGIQLWQGNNNTQQKWTYDFATKRITGLGGKCLDVPSHIGQVNGAKVQIWDCNGGVSQQWEIGPNGRLIGFGGRCLDAEGQSGANGTRLQVWDCSGTSNQSWKLRGEIYNPASGKCLDDPGFGAVNGARPHLWTCYGGTNQKWTFFSH